MSYKTWFVYDKETGYILSGFDSLDNPEDGYNPYNRPFKYKDLHPKDELCDLDYIFKMNVLDGLTSLKKENMVVTTTSETDARHTTFIKNPRWYERGAARGWWKLDCI